MALLQRHLEHISLSSAAIAEQSFIPPRMFTNALLHPHHITALIRDTEPHERALFKTNPNRKSTDAGRSQSGDQERARGKANIATLLGGSLGRQVQQETLKDGRDRGDVNIEILLQGAEKLCQIYPVSGAASKIASLRTRHDQLCESVERYETLVERQNSQLARLSRPTEEQASVEHDTEPLPDDELTEEEVQREIDEIAELEQKKAMLEDRVMGIERDLGGLKRV